MEILQGFAGKGTIEQVIILEELRENAKVNAIPELFEITANPLGDQVIDEMVYHTLFELLRSQENYLMKGLAHSSEAVQLVCVRSAVETNSEEIMNSLLTLLGSTDKVEIMAEILRILANYQDVSLIDILVPYILHEDCTVMGEASQALDGYQDNRVRDHLIQLLAESDEVRGITSSCSLRTGLALEGLAKYNDEKSIDVLIGYIHHSNPSFRREVISVIVTMGTSVFSTLTNTLEKGDKDEKILAANIIGMVGERTGADILINFIEKADELNFRFALYEALGRISSLRSLTSLADGLIEKNELVLMAVVTGLNNLFNPGVVKVITESISHDIKVGRRIIDAIITGRANKIFIALYQEGTLNDKIMDALLASKDLEAMANFRHELEKLDDKNAAKDISLLATSETGPNKEKRILAADDSKAMLFFYKGVAADLEMEMVTVEDGKQALEYLQKDDNFDLIITDMNMPNMDGIELAREIRTRVEWKDLPLLMATTESEASQTELARKAGIDDFITKPFTKDIFKAKVKSILS